MTENDENVKVIQRSDVWNFLSCIEADGSHTYYRMDLGFSNLGDNPNAQQETEGYIGSISLSTIVEGYAQEYPFTVKKIISERPIAEMENILKYQLSGGEAQRFFVAMDFWQEPISGYYPAYSEKVTIIIDNNNGEPTKSYIMSGTIKPFRKRIHGWFNPETKEFYSQEDFLSIIPSSGKNNKNNREEIKQI